MGPAWTDALGSVRHSIIGTAEEFTVEGGSRDQSVALSSPLRSNLDGEAESLSVTIKFTDADGSLFQSLIERIAEADLTC